MPDSHPAPSQSELPAVRDTPVTGAMPLYFCGDDGHLYLLEPDAVEARRLSWSADDFSLMPGLPALPGSAGELDEGLVFVHPAPSPDGTRVAAFGVDPADDVDELEEEDGEEWETVLDLPQDEDDTAGPGLLPVSLPEGKVVAVPVGRSEEEDEDEDGVFWPGARLFVLHADGVQVQEAWGFDDGGPIHLEWAPDGRRLLALRQQESTLELHLVDPDRPEATVQLGEGAPLFWAWQPGGDRILLRSVHPDGAQLHLAAPDGDRPTRLLGPSGSFYSPAWRPDGSCFAHGIPGGREDRLVLADPEGGLVRELMSYPGRAAFRWDGAGRRLGVAIAPEGTGSFETLLEVDPDTGAQTTRYQGSFVAFEWLPDGRSWLVCTSDEEAGRLHWAVVDDEGGFRPLGGAFSPSRETMIALHFFDQVAGSRSFLSEDGRAVAWAGHPADLPSWIGRRDMPGALPASGRRAVPRVLLTPLDGGASHIVGVGPYACFPPRR